MCFGVKSLFKGMQFQFKLFISFSVLTCVLLSVSTGLFYFYTGSIVEKNVVVTQQHTVQKIQEQLDLLLAQIDNMTISVNSSDMIMNVLENIPEIPDENYFDTYPKISEEIRNYLFSLTALKPLNGRISIVSKYHDFLDFSNQSDTQNITKSDVRKFAFVKEAMQTDRYKFFLPPHQDEWTSKGKSVFSVVRPLRSTNYEIQGLIEVSYNLEQIDRLFEVEGNSRVLQGAIFDQNQTLIYHNFNIDSSGDWLHDDNLDTANYGNYKVKNPESHRNYLVTFNKLAAVDWSMLLLEDNADFERPIIILRTMTWVSYFSIFAIFLIILYIYTRNITRPIRSLKQSVLSVNMDSLRLRLKTGQRNEITLLAQAFQDLLDEVKGTMDLMVESRSREMSAHMSAMQAQMNPHFLYNTLAVIGAYGIKKGNIEVMQMCADLSDMLRYTIDSDNGKTTLRSEVIHMQNYLKLMSLRFETDLQVEIDMDEALMEVPIPKLTLEPLVENIFRHAFMDVEPPWVLKMKGTVRNGRWAIEIKDNGRGFGAGAIRQIKHKMEEDRYLLQSGDYFDKSKGGIGMINTFMRLRLFYKGNETIEFYNSDQGGAIVVIGGPIGE
ncbi:HAMP domain-containing protein [Paenibacillus sp. LMG 31458]|uniref:HAMP domain-containing protein n=2 Tax=Paenibacillus phytorum TaxID=2654977 RepID=A0ABX1Y890_9BACL|nr:HAMP domain-containing protein [Paenibacillus phytorum]